jgi:hypothetical protein
MRKHLHPLRAGRQSLHAAIQTYGKSAGCGFVEMGSDEQAMKAVVALKEPHGRQISSVSI